MKHRNTTGPGGDIHVVDGWIATAATVLLGLFIGVWSPHLSPYVVRRPAAAELRRSFTVGLVIAALLLACVVLSARTS